MLPEDHSVYVQHSLGDDLRWIQDWIFIKDTLPRLKPPDPTGIAATLVKKLQESNMSEDALKDYFKAVTGSSSYGYESWHKVVDMNIRRYSFAERFITDFVAAFNECSNVQVPITPYQAAAKLIRELSRGNNLASCESARLSLSDPEFDPNKYTKENFHELCQSGRHEFYRLKDSSLSIVAQKEQELEALDKYRCNTDYFRTAERRFWRVQHAESRAESTSCGDIVASNTTTVLRTCVDLKEAVELHLDWGCRIPSSFISVFGDRKHAINWAIAARNRQEKRREYSPVHVQEINAAYLDDVYVLDLGRIVRELDISCENVEHEYLILYHIPTHALESITDVAILEERALEASEWENRWQDPRYHWVDDLHGYYDTDEECEEHNANDDLIKMIEGDWD